MITDSNPLVEVGRYASTKASYARDCDAITPRNRAELVVCVVARISGGPRQKELSLDDQVDHAKEVIAEYYEGPVEVRVVATTGKGENLERPELLVVEELLRSRDLDLLVCEDIGRLVRGADAVRLCGIAVDHETRVLAPNDAIDTNEADWEEGVIQACRDHVGHNSHCSKRIKQKKMNRFRKFGGATPCEIAGYFKPADAKTYADWRRIDSATPFIREGMRVLKETLNCSRVADYFNEQGFKPGPYTRRKSCRWDGKMVRRFFANMLLAGKPGRGYRHTVKHHERGKRISLPNPAGPDFIDCPHLAHVDQDELIELNDLLRQNNSKLGRKKVAGVDPRLRVPRKTTVFPSQHARCYYCGCNYIRGGNGIAGHIGCSNIREWRCWNTVGVSCELAAKAVMKALTDFVLGLDKVADQFADMVKSAHRDRVGVSAEQWRQLAAEEGKTATEMSNLTESMKSFGPTPEITVAFEGLERRRQQLARERRSLENATRRELTLPDSWSELRAAFETKAEGLAITSPEFGDLMRQLVPELNIYLVRLLDGGHPVPRARAKLDLTGCFSDLAYVPDMVPLLTRVVTLDLFVPPQRERLRKEVVALKGIKQREIAKRLSEPSHQVVVQQALTLDGMMQERGLTDAYQLLLEPPADYRKLRRHKNSRYKFQPLEHYERPTL